MVASPLRERELIRQIGKCRINLGQIIAVFSHSKQGSVVGCQGQSIKIFLVLLHTKHSVIYRKNIGSSVK